MTEAEQNSAKMLERIRALLAKASSTTFPEEADAFRAKADELMTKYAVEMWQVDQAQQGTNAQQKPIARALDLSWWYDMDSDLASSLWSMFIGVTGHCRCRVAHKNADYTSKTIPVVGMQTDLDYCDMLFTNLMLQLITTMDPRPQPGESTIEALVRMKEAGIKWEECYYRLRTAGHYPADQPWQAAKMNFAGKYTRYCEERGRDRVRVAPGVYRRSFTQGFVAAIKSRLQHQREEQGQTSGSMAVALRDISQVVTEAMHEMYPNQAKRSRAVGRADHSKLDLGTMGAGNIAGQKATIVGKGDRNLKAQKELR